jgi:two-component system, NarL family, sensor kinase
MTGVPNSRRPLESLPAAVAVAGTALVLVAFVSMAARGRPVEAIFGHWMIHNGPTGVISLWLGYLVTRREPNHRAGWLLVAIGALSAVHVGLVALVDHRMIAAGVAHSGQRFEAVVPSSMPLDVMIPMWFSAWLWIPVLVMAVTVFLLVFPDGELPRGRRRYGFHLSIAAATTLSLAYMVETWPWADDPIIMSDSIGRNRLAASLLMVGGTLLVMAVVLSISTLVGRWRNADLEQRRRMRPVVFTAIAFAVLGVTLYPWQWVWIPTALVLIWTLLGSYAFAIARYRLHDLDIFVSRAAVAAVLAVTLTATYLAIVVGVGQLAGRGRENTLLPLVAAAVVAVAFDPLRRRVRRLVDRLLYGHDHDAYEVLHGIADRLRSASSAEDVLTDIAQLLVRGTGAEQIEIVTTVRGTDRVLATDGQSDRPDALWAVPVVHEHDHLGHVRVFARSTADLAPGASSLVEDAAATLGVVLRNAQLTVDLEEQVRALRRSSERLLHAHDEARRSLERDIHDGAQARLIALKIRLGMAGRQAAATGDRELTAMLDGTCAEIDRAIHTLRSLGHGLRPSALEGAGMAAAIRSEARGLPMDVIVEAPAVGRYDPAVESAVFFSCLEAIQNSAKHGRADQVHVQLSNGSDGLTFSVTDDGTGFDPEHTPDGNGLTNVRDRVTSLGGDVRIEAAAGRGTTVTGHVPVQPLVSER